MEPNLPSRRHPKSRSSVRWLLIACGIFVLAGIGLGAASLLGANPFGSWFTQSQANLLTHEVHPEYLQATIVERGTLESAENADVLCLVKAGSKGTFSSTIKWVIDDGTLVNKGELLMQLDDSSLQNEYRDQSIVVDKSRAEWVTADENFTITQKQNESDTALKLAALQVAELDLDKYLGIRSDPGLIAIGSVAGALATLTERGEYKQTLDDVSGRLKLAEADLEAYRDRASWANRSVRLQYLTPSQAKVEQSKLAGALDGVEKLRKEQYVLETFLRQRNLTDFRGKVEVAELDYEGALRQASAKLNQAESERKTKYSVYQQELDKLREVEQQINLCKIYSPQSGMVVYYKEQSRRDSSGSIVAVGEQVKEGQKLLRIPNLDQMQVSTSVHEALVSKLRGDDRHSTGYFSALRAGLLAAPGGDMIRLVNQSSDNLGTLRDQNRDKEMVLASQGQDAWIRVDAFPQRRLKGHVRSVASVAAQADYFSSDVKVYQTIVTIDDEEKFNLKPDMSAEVTIEVDPPNHPVLAVPIQAIFGGAENGAMRRLFVLTSNGPEERTVKLGLATDKMVEVSEGLSDGETVILNPKELLKNREQTDVPAEQTKGPPSGKPRS